MELKNNNDYYDDNQIVQSEQKFFCGDRGRPLLVGTKADCGSGKLPWGFRQVDKASMYLSFFLYLYLYLLNVYIYRI